MTCVSKKRGPLCVDVQHLTFVFFVFGEAVRSDVSAPSAHGNLISPIKALTLRTLQVCHCNLFLGGTSL